MSNPWVLVLVSFLAINSIKSSHLNREPDNSKNFPSFTEENRHNPMDNSVVEAVLLLQDLSLQTGASSEHIRGTASPKDLRRTELRQEEGQIAVLPQAEAKESTSPMQFGDPDGPLPSPFNVMKRRIFPLRSAAYIARFGADHEPDFDEWVGNTRLMAEEDGSTSDEFIDDEI